MDEELLAKQVGDLTIEAEPGSSLQRELDPTTETGPAPPNQRSESIRRLLGLFKEKQLLYDPADFDVYGLQNSEALFLKFFLGHDLENVAFEEMISNYAVSPMAYWLVSHFVWRLSAWDDVKSTSPDQRKDLANILGPDALADYLYDYTTKPPPGELDDDYMGGDLEWNPAVDISYEKAGCFKAEIRDEAQLPTLNSDAFLSKESDIHFHLEREIIRRVVMGYPPDNIAEDITENRTTDHYWCTLTRRYKDTRFECVRGYEIEAQLFWRLHNWKPDLVKSWERHPKPITRKILAWALHEGPEPLSKEVLAWTLRINGGRLKRFPAKLGDLPWDCLYWFRRHLLSEASVTHCMHSKVTPAGEESGLLPT